MPGQFLTTAERERLSKFPKEIPKEDIYTFFTLTPSDLNQIPIRSANYNRLGFALQLGALRYLGFCPDELTTAPSSVIVYTTNQLGIDSPSLSAYAQRPQTRTDHLLKIQEYLGFRRASDYDLAKLSEWLLKRALEHDKPTLLFQMACQRLYSERIVRPGVTTLERMVIQARQEAQEETYRQLNFLMGDDLKTFLDKILIKDENLGRTPFFWLRHGATANTPKNILEAIEKLDFLRENFVDKWHLSSLNPNRQKFLAQIGRSASNQALQRMSEQRRYPILLAFLRQSLIDIIDELIELFDRCLWDAHTKARRENQEFRLTIAKTTNEKLILFQQIGRTVLDKTYLIPKDKWPTIRPEALRLLGLSEIGDERLEQRKAQLQKALNQFDKQLSNNDDVKIEKGKLVISPLKAEDLPPSSVQLRELVDQRLPLVDLTDLLIEVDGWTNFTDCFEHPGGHQPRTIDLLTHLFASILANACNFGLAKMAQTSDLTYDQLAWCNNFCLGFTPHPKVLVKPRRQLVSA